jgi:hypothetical protein
MCAGKPVPITAADTVVFTGHLGDHLYGSIAKAPPPRDDLNSPASSAAAEHERSETAPANL